MKKKVLLFGAQGLLGTEFVYLEHPELEIIPLSRFHLDLTSTEKIAPEIEKFAPDAVVNCAAWTAVEEAENSQFQKKVLQMNVDAPQEMAKSCTKLGIPFFHISTDFVFGGVEKNAAFAETAAKNPLNFYGKSKSLGEDAVLTHCKQAFVIRTAWLYGEYGANFVERIGQRAKKESEIAVVSDQFGNPTWTKYVAKILCTLIVNAENAFTSGLYHAVSETGKSPPSWYDFAQEILRLKNMSTPLIPIQSHQLETRVKRPVSSILKNTKLPPFLDWKQMLEEFLQKEKK